MKLNHNTQQVKFCVVVIFNAILAILQLGAEEQQVLATDKEASQKEKTATVKCDRIFTEVVTAVTAEPDKVLVIVEENTLASPDCVCEIIKAAVKASTADEELTRQIMLTALNAAPEKAKVIEICIAALKSEGDMQAVVRKGGKEVVNVQGKEVVNVQYGGKDIQPLAYYGKGDLVDPPVTGGDYYILPSDIRGVYLVPPAAGGFFPPDDDDDRPDPDPPTKPTPLSPSVASAKRR